MACYKKSNKVQKVVIPKGMINPGETTIIEIPVNLQKQPIVVAKKKTSEESINKTSGKKNGQYKHPSRTQAGPSNRNTPPYIPPATGGEAQAQDADLESTERKEREQFLKDLDEFQKARRKLLSNATFLAGENSQYKKI